MRPIMRFMWCSTVSRSTTKANCLVVDGIWRQRSGAIFAYANFARTHVTKLPGAAAQP
jgi:hypothetical protein